MRSNEGADQVSISIDKKLADLSPSEPNCYFFRVHNQLRKVNAKAYEPKVIAIGPYQRHMDYLYMEEQKLLYFKSLLNRQGQNVNDYVLAVRKLEADLRKCYAEPIDLDESQFVEMMLLDGCFIIELFRKFDMPYLRDKDDPIFTMSWMVNSLQRDLMLFENQVPFSVLETLFEIIKIPNPNHKTLSSLVLRFFRDILPVPNDKQSIQIDDVIWKGKRKHLLSFIHDNWSYKIANNQPVKDENKNWRFIQCATKLREAGIQFEKNEGGSLFDIKFANGVMQIPPLTIEDRTETFFRNLIAYEQYSLDVYFKIVTDYVKFMDTIIDTPQDVAILEHHDIIDNWLGGGKAVSSMFNQITDSVTGPGNNFLYAGICVDVKKHCSKSRNRWMEILRANYLNSPWGVISIVGAIILLLLTFTQTLFTVFPRK